MSITVILKKLKKISTSHVGCVLFAVSFLLVFVYLNVVNNKNFYYDSRYYNDLSNIFIQDNIFNLYNFPDTYRGVIFPLILFFFNRFAMVFSQNPVMGWRIFISLLLAAVTTILPQIFKPLKEKTNFLFRLIPLVCILFFWYGLINYTLSDLTALSLLVIGMFFCIKALSENSNETNKAGEIWWKYISAFLSGAFLYAAYNTRTIYLFSVCCFIVSIIVFKLLWGSVKSIRSLLVKIALVLLGIIAVGLIEGLINYHYYDIRSIFVVSKYGEYDSLFIFQLMNGLHCAQYETFVGNSLTFPFPGVLFVDKYGATLVESFASSTNIFAFLNNLIVAMGVYLRHFINMLNPVWGGGAFIQDINAVKIHRSLINYTFIFISAKYFFMRAENKKAKDYMIFVKKNYITLSATISLLIAFFAIIPGAIEQRFSIPFYILLYTFIAYFVDYKMVFLSIKQKPFKNTIIYISIYIFLFLQWATTYSSTSVGIALSAF